MVSYKLVRDAPMGCTGMYTVHVLCPQSLHIIYIMYICNLHYLNSHTHTQDSLVVNAIMHVL